MRSFFLILAIILAILRFWISLAWIGAMISGILALFSAPPRIRPDGKRRTGDLLSSLWDDMMVSAKMKDCPHYRSKIMNDATKCPHCGESVGEGT